MKTNESRIQAVNFESMDRMWLRWGYEFSSKRLQSSAPSVANASRTRGRRPHHVRLLSSQSSRQPRARLHRVFKFNPRVHNSVLDFTKTARVRRTARHFPAVAAHVQVCALHIEQTPQLTAVLVAQKHMLHVHLLVLIAWESHVERSQSAYSSNQKS